MKTWWNILICMWIYFIYGAVNINGTFELTSSPLTATDGELFTLTCSIHNGSAANIGWLQNNKSKVVTQNIANCGKNRLAYDHDFISRINVSCNDTIHSISFRFNSTTDQRSAWQCGKSVNDTYIYPRSNTLPIGPVMSTLSLSTTTGYMDQETVTTTDGTDEHDHTASHVMSTQSSTSTTRNTEMTSDQETVTTKDGMAGHGHASSSVMSTQSSSTTTRNTEMTSDQETVTTKDGEKDPNLLYIVVGAVGGAVLLTVVVVGVVCIRWRRKSAYQQNHMKEERKNKATRVYQNTSDCNTVDNDLYEGSRDVQPMNQTENQEDDFMLSDACEGVNMPVTNTCTPREEVPSGDVNLENLYAKPDKSKHTEIQHVSDIYAEVQKPKKKKQDPMVSEDFNTGDVYAKPNKGLKAHK